MNKSDIKALEPLPLSFSPGRWDVICAKGSFAKEHEGNQRLKALVRYNLPMYSACKCKLQKSRIVSGIVNSVNDASPQGGFIKFSDDQWWVCSERKAREKVGQAFRDMLFTKYPSSTKAKAQKCKEQAFDDELEPAAVPMNEQPAEIPKSSSSVVSWTSSNENDGDTMTMAMTNRVFPTKPPSVVSCIEPKPLGANITLAMQYQQLFQAASSSTPSLLNLGDNQITGKIVPSNRPVAFSGCSLDDTAKLSTEPKFTAAASQGDLLPLLGDFEPLPIEESTLDKYFDLSSMVHNEPPSSTMVVDNIGEVCHLIFDEYL